jgi:hypothetical protein
MDICIAALALLAAASAAAAAAQQNRSPAATAPARVLLQPRFKPGQVTRYHMTLESDSSTHQSGSVKDPQGPGELDVTWDATIRLEVSAAEKGPGAASPARAAARVPVRIRITYESSQATVRSDTVEPQADNIQRQYSQLAGRSLEFTLAAGGQVSDVRGLEDFLTDDKARSAAEQWIVGIAAASAVPAAGVVPGQKWNSTRAAELPLAGLSWRTDSTYVRNEPCALAVAATPSGDAGPGPPTVRAECALILSRLALITTRAVSDATPDDYRRRNLRTSGHWNGNGQSLMYVSLDTGWVVSSTQESTQEMDVTIDDVSPNPAGAARNAGSVTTRSQVSLLDDDAPVSAPPAASPGTSSRGALPTASTR